MAERTKARAWRARRGLTAPRGFESHSLRIDGDPWKVVVAFRSTSGDDRCSFHTAFEVFLQASRRYTYPREELHDIHPDSNEHNPLLGTNIDPEHYTFPETLASVAQLVERGIRNAQVGGSSPPAGSLQFLSALTF